jgi:protease I
MHYMSSSGKRVAMVIAPNYEDVEATDPKEALEQAGAEVTLVGIEKGEVQGKKGAILEATETFGTVSPDDFDMLVIPGGGAPENLRIDDGAVAFTRRFVESGKPVASICHGPWTVIEAGAARGRRVTSWPSLRTDLKNAGAEWVDEEAVVDQGLVTSRNPDDIPAFNRAMIGLFGQERA